MRANERERPHPEALELLQRRLRRRNELRRQRRATQLSAVPYDGRRLFGR